jgi:hypothetical protein
VTGLVRRFCVKIDPWCAFCGRKSTFSKPAFVAGFCRGGKQGDGSIASHPASRRISAVKRGKEVPKREYSCIKETDEQL